MKNNEHAYGTWLVRAIISAFEMSPLTKGLVTQRLSLGSLTREVKVRVSSEVLGFRIIDSF